MSNGLDPSTRKFPTTVKEVRRQLSLSREDLCHALVVSFAAINRWDNNSAKPRPLALEKIESLLRSLGDKGKALHKAYFEKEA